jgi:hypothetical protein
MLLGRGWRLPCWQTRSFRPGCGPRQLEVFGGDARQGEADRSVAHGFPHRVRNEFELIEQRPLVGIIAEKVHAAGRW